MYDVFFISYDEPNADENWDLLKQKMPVAQRVHGVKGILNAHKQCAEKCSTKMFYVVDGDSEVMESFDFKYIPPDHQQSFIHVWRARNPVNGLIYGYGGIKLLPVRHVLDMPAMATDMTTSLSNAFVVMPNLASITHFNSSPFNAWRAAFRECTKLSSQSIERQNTDETVRRLEIWKTMGAHKVFGKYVIEGAEQGQQFGQANAEDRDQLSRINDFDWLKERFKGIYGDNSI